MAPNFSSSSSNNNVAASFQGSSETRHRKVEAGGFAGGVKQDGSPKRPSKAVDDEGHFADFDDSKSGEDERFPTNTKDKKAEEGRKEPIHNVTKELPMRCEKCNMSFKSVEERTLHIKNSRKHFCCQKCEATVEFRDFLDLCAHYKSHHCHRCSQHFGTVEEGNMHKKTSPRHFCCKICDDIVEFNSAYNLRLHYKKRHPSQYCYICELHFAAVDKCLAHMKENHVTCGSCDQYYFDPDLFRMHRMRCGRRGPPKREGGTPMGRGDTSKGKEAIPPSHYTTLGINPYSSHEEVIKVAREMRVKTHPDRLKRGRVITVEQEKDIDTKAALVGQAADILSDLGSRARYDRELRLKTKG